MKRFGTISVIVVFFSIFAMMVWAQPQKQFQPSQPLTKVQTQSGALLLSISRVRGPEMMKYLNKQVTIEGFYYDGSIPLVVDDFKRVFLNKPMPQDSYVPIIGPKPVGIRWGDHISITGLFVKPTNVDPQTVQKESVIIKVPSSEFIKILRSRAVQKSSIQGYKVGPMDVKTVSSNYAILIAGGLDPANNHVRYWNDLKAMYNILLANGYAKGNIAVIYADGVVRDTSMPVHYAAKKSNIAAVFNLLSNKITSNDTLYIMTNDHGATGALCLWGENITANEFSNEVNKVKGYSKMIILMEQCYSGSFIPPLTGSRRTVMSACSATETSSATDSLQFNEFTYWYFAALTGFKPDGGGAVNADSNGDGKISILEAYNFARSKDMQLETPFFEDDGVSPAHSGSIPSGGDGNRSANIYLSDIPLKIRVRVP